MTTHHITNKTPSMLDMSPLKDVLDRVLTLRGGEERDISDETLGHPIMQRMIHAQWVTVGDAPATPPLQTTPSTPAAAVPPPEPEPAPAPEPAPPSTPEAVAPMPLAKKTSLVKETKKSGKLEHDDADDH